jgi:hypothetical protein
VQINIGGCSLATENIHLSKSFIRISVAFIMILSIIQVAPFDDPVIDSVSAASSMVHDTQPELNSGTKSNVEVSAGQVKLTIRNNNKWDNLRDQSKIDSKNYVVYDNSKDEVRLYQTFNRTFGSPDREGGVEVHTTSDGGFIIIGGTNSTPSGNWDIILIKTDADGTLEWNRSYGGSENESAASCQQTKDGGYIIFGETDNASVLHDDLWIIKTDLNGTEEWNKTFNLNDGCDAGSIEQTSDKGYIFTAQAFLGPADSDVWLVKTDQFGIEIWSKTFGNGSAVEAGTEVHQTSDKGYIIIGNSRIGSDNDAWLIKINTSGGMEWNSTFGWGSYDFGYSLQATSDGGYIIGGTADPSETLTYVAWLVKTNASGGEQWNNTFGLWGEEGYCVKQTPDGGYIFSGFMDSDAWLVKTNSTGGEQWNRTFGGNKADQGRSVLVHSDGGYVITGVTDSFGAGQGDVWLIKTTDQGLFNPTGYLTSKNLLNTNEEYTSITSFKCNVSIPSGTFMKVQFSQDKTNWYDSSKTKDDWNTLSQGNKTISLTGLNWAGSKFYYRMNFTSTNNDVPKLHYTRLNYQQYRTSGTLTSARINSGASSSWRQISWSGPTPAGTSIKFKIKTAPTSAELTSAPWAGPTGTGANNYYITSGTTIWPGHEGNRWMQYQASLSTTDQTFTPTLTSVSISYNRYPAAPTLTGPVNDTWISENRPTFGWAYTTTDDSSGQAAFQWQVDDSEAFNSIDYGSGVITSPVSSYIYTSTLPDGVWNWRVRTRDSDGNWSVYSKPRVLKVDTTVGPPSAINMNPPIWTSETTFSAYWTNPADPSGIGGAYYKLEEPPTHNTDGTPYSGVNIKQIGGIQVTTDGVHTIYVWLRDNLGNMDYNNYISTEFYVDTTAPKSPQNVKVVPSTWSSSNTFSIFWDNPEDDSGIIGIYYKFHTPPTSDTDGTYVSGDNIESIADIELEAGGEHIVYLWLKDRAKNINFNTYAISSLKYDNTPPEKPLNLKPDPDDWTSQNSFSIDWDNPPDESGYKNGAFIHIDKDPPPSQSFGTWMTSKPFTLSALPEGENTVYVWLEDTVGNRNVKNYESISLKLDITIPRDLSIVINDGGEYTDDEDVRLTLDAEDDLSGVEDMSFSFDGKKWSGWEEFDTTKKISIPPDDGNSTVYFRVRDNAGNIAQATDSIILDTTPPSSLYISINSDDFQAKSTSVNLTLNAKDDSSDVYQMSFSNDGMTWSDWEPFAKLVQYTLTPGDGGKTVYFRVNDRLGNVAEYVSDSILLNTTPVKPSGNGVPNGGENGDEGKSPSDKGFLSGNTITIIVAIVIVIIVISIISVYLTKKHEKKKTKEVISVLTSKAPASQVPAYPPGTEMPVEVPQETEAAPDFFATPDEQKKDEEETQPKAPQFGHTLSIDEIPEEAPALQEPKKEKPSKTEPEPELEPTPTVEQQAVPTQDQQYQQYPMGTYDMQQMAMPTCPNCGQPISYFEQNNAWYCYYCQMIVG